MDAPGAHRRRHFASDNNSGVCPEVWAALEAANVGHVPGYGDDPWTARACELIRELFETDCEVFLVFNGTAANALALASMVRPFHAVLCHDHSHVHLDECGAPEFFSGGAKLLPLAGEHGRLVPAQVEEAIQAHFPLHSSKPGALSLTQATECGTVYRADDLAALTEVAHRHGLRVHLDGARFANATASLGAAPKSITWQVGVDMLSLGGTKNGGLGCEALVVFNRALALELDYRIKQAGQLASKMRFAAAAWIGLLGSGAWLKHATHANRQAAQLARLLPDRPDVRLLHPCQANGVFVDLPAPAIRKLHACGWRFYVFEGETGCRLMCSWDTTDADLAEFTNDLRAALPAESTSSRPRARSDGRPGRRSRRRKK